jgi:hypothetical protein
VALQRQMTSFGGFEGDLINGSFSGTLLFVSRVGGEAWLQVWNPVSTSGGYAIRNYDTAFTNLSSGETGVAKTRFRFVIDTALPTATIYVGGFGTLSNECRAMMRLSTTGTFYAMANGTLSAQSTAALSVGVTYLIEISTTITNNPSGNDSQTCTVTVKTDDGTLIESVTATYNTFFISNPIIHPPFLGSPSLDASAVKRLRYRDWYTIAGDDTDTASVVLPTATRIDCAPVTGQGASADWTGSYNLVKERPRDATTGEQTTTVDEASTTFTHASAASLGIEGIEAVQVVAQVKAASGGVEALLLDGTEHAVTVATSYSAPTAVKGMDITAWSTARFDAAEFGVRNKRGVSTQVSKIYLDVLHAGSGPAPRAHSWKHKIVTYTGDGSYQSITGVGFTPSKILIKKVLGGNSPGCYWCEEIGGTQSKVINDAALASTAVMGVHSDGFDLGPNTAVNQSGIAYVALCIDDGGTDAEGYYVKSGVYLGDSVDGRDIVIGMAPSVVMTFGSSIAILRTADMVGDFSVRLGSTTTTTNGIQALNADGFEIGTDSALNSTGAFIPWLALALGSKIEEFFAYGSFAGTGANIQVTGIPFTPEFGFADTAAAQDGAWRSTLVHGSGTNSTSWSSSGTGTISTGLRAFGAGTIDFGTQISVAANNAYWVAFNLEGDVPDPTEVDFFTGDGRVSQPLTWLELTKRSGELKAFAEVDLNDHEDYYGGYKVPWVTQFLPITRGLSDRLGQLEHLSFGAMISDTTRYFRELLSNPVEKYLANRPLTERMIDDEDRRQELVPRIVASGFVSNYSPRPNLMFELTGSDWLKKKFSRKAKAALAWQPDITLEDFPTAPEAVVGQTVPLIYGEVSDLTIVSDPLSDVTGLAAAVTGGGDANHKSLATVVAELQASKTAGTLVDDFGSRIGYGDAAALQAAPGVVPSDYFDLAEVIGYADLNFLLSGEGQTNRYAVTAVNEYGRETAPAYIDVPGAPVDAALGASSFVHLTWDAVPGATSYKVYGRQPGVSYYLSSDVPLGTPEYFDGKRVDGTARVDTPDVTKPAPGSNQTDVENDAGYGVVVPPYVGIVTMDSKEWHRFLVAGHACKSILGWYIDGVRQALTTESAEAFLMPGYATYQSIVGADPYEEINGRYYTLCYILKGSAIGDEVAAGSKKLTLNVQGIEDVGDGSGTLITSIVQQTKHFLRNFLAPETPQRQLWLTECPTFPHLPDLPLVDEDSFDATETSLLNRLPSGYVGAGIIGAQEEVPALDALARFSVSGDFDTFFNRKGQVAATAEPTSATAELPGLNDVINIIEGSFDIVDDVTGEFFNILPYAHTKDYTGRQSSGWMKTTEVKDDISILNYDQERSAPRYDLYMLREPQCSSTILDVMSRKLIRFRDPRRKIRLMVPFSGLSFEPGSTVPLSAAEGIGAEGWNDHDVRLMRHEVDPTNGTVTLEAYDLESTFNLVGVFAPEDAPDYADATEEERRTYLYFAPSAPATTYPEDGAPLKTFS